MEDLLIFTGIALFAVCPLAIFIVWLVYKNTVQFPLGLVLAWHGLFNAVLGFAVSKYGFIHLTWAGLLSLLNGLVCLYYLSLRVSAPVKTLTNVINLLASGNLKISIDHTYLQRKDEIGQISGSIETMIANLNKSIEIASLVSKGRLHLAVEETKNIKTNGELDIAMKDMIIKLNEIVKEIRNGAELISGAAVEISSSSQTVANSANQQASSIEEISSSMEEMLASINQNAENATQTEIIAKKASENIITVSNVVLNTINSMKQVIQKISFVNEISQKTDLLAINAAIEAARAGEHGKGFGVVATEIRKLAERSKRAALEISELSSNTIKDAENSGRLLQDLTPDIQKTAFLVQEISASSIEQRSGSEQINSAISQLSNVTQENAATAEELAASSELFIQQSRRQNEIVAFFKIDARQEQGIKETLIIKMNEMIMNLDFNNLNNLQKAINERIQSNDKTNKPFENKISNKNSEYIPEPVKKIDTDEAFEVF